MAAAKVLLLDITKRDSQVTDAFYCIFSSSKNFTIIGCPPAPLNRAASRLKRSLSALWLIVAAFWSLLVAKLRHSGAVVVILNYNNTHSVFDNIIIRYAWLLRLRLNIVTHVSGWPVCLSLFRSNSLARFGHHLVDLTQDSNHPPINIGNVNATDYKLVVEQLTERLPQRDFLLIPHGFHAKYLTPLNLDLLRALSQRFFIVVAGSEPPEWERLGISNIYFIGPYTYNDLIALFSLSFAALYICTGPTTSGAIYSTFYFKHPKVALATYKGSLPEGFGARFVDPCDPTQVLELFDSLAVSPLPLSEAPQKCREYAEQYAIQYHFSAQDWLSRISNQMVCASGIPLAAQISKHHAPRNYI